VSQTFRDWLNEVLADPMKCGLRVATVMLLAGACAAVARAAEPSVPYVPTPQEVVERMLQIAKVTRDDYLIDLGSGDGRIVVTAAKKFGARGFGVDLNPQRIAESNANAKRAGVTDKVAFHQRDLFETDLSDATVITMYLLPRVNLELRPKLLDLKPGTRVVSHDFSMEDWKADTHVQVEAQDKYGGSGGRSDIYFWVVPAKVAGTWQWQLTVSGKSQSYEVTLDQKFQEIAGTARIGGRSVKLQNAKLRGDRISFDFTADVNGAPVKHEFNGKVEGAAIEGNARLSGSRVQAQLDWSAKRAGVKTSAASCPILCNPPQ
jgi:methyltransferase family protein